MSGSLDESGKDGAGGGMVKGFRVPLHSQDKVVRRAFQGFHHSVGSQGGRKQARRRRSDGLVVKAVYRQHAFAHQAGQAGAGQDPDCMRGITARRLLLMLQQLRL